MGFGGFLELQVIELPEDLYKWLMDNFDLYLVTLYKSSDKKIEIIQMNVLFMCGTPNWWKKG